MSKTLLVTLLAVAGTAFWTNDAQARWRRNCGMRTQTWVTAPTTTVMASQPAAPVAQSNSGTSYQSYSYEPGQNNGSIPVNSVIGSAVMARAPSGNRSNSFEYANVLRGDRKVRGHTAEGE